MGSNEQSIVVCQIDRVSSCPPPKNSADALGRGTVSTYYFLLQFQAAVLQRWNLPYFMCALCPFVQALSVSVSIFTLTAVAIDRHRAILKPLRYVE